MNANPRLISYVAFLRGINVGGNALISMATLREYFEELGFHDVSTYINSGNVIFRITTSDARKLESQITKALVRHFNTEVATVVLRRTEIDELLAQLPTAWKKPAEERRNVIFLRHEIDNACILEHFDPKPSIESVTYVPHALLWSARTSDLARSTMTKLSRSPLYKQMTVRTLGTVQKVQTLLHKLDDN